MATNDACLKLFESKTVIMFTDYLWDTSLPFFVLYYFLPFMLLGQVPLLVMAFMMFKIENDEVNHEKFPYIFFSALMIF